MFRAPRGKVAHLLFFLIRFPAILQDSQRVQLLLSAVDWEPPCFKSLHGDALAREKNTPPHEKIEHRNKLEGDKMEPTPKQVFSPFPSCHVIHSKILLLAL